MKLKSLLIILLFAIGTQAFAQTDVPKTLPIDPAVRIGRLDNGLTYYLRHNNWPEKRADFYIAQRVGSIQEEESQRGLAHFLEHMCFNGTTNFPGDALLRYCESLGVKFGVDLNAYTSIDQTVYNISNVPTTRQSALDSCLLILYDWANELTLDPKEIDQERGVIHEEWRQSTSSGSRLLERNLPALYPGSKYGLRYPIGLMSVVDNFKYKELRDYYEKWYHPSNQGIIIVGDIDVDHTEAMIKKLFGKVRNPENQAPVVAEPVPDNHTPIVIIDKDKETQSSGVEIIFKHDVYPDSLKKNTDYVLHLFKKNIALMLLNSRLSESAQAPECPYLGASANHGSYIFANTKSAFTLGASPKDISQTATALRVALEEAYRAADYGFTETEYQRALSAMQSALDKAYAERDKRHNAGFANEYKGNFLANEPIPAFEDYYRMMQKLIPTIQIQDINDVLKQLVSRSDTNMVIVNFNNEKEGNVYPTEQQLLQAVKEARTKQLATFVDKVRQEPLMAQLPKPGKIKKEKKSDKFDYKVLTLSNGVTVILKKTDYKKEQIVVSGVGPGGKSLYGPADYINLKVFKRVIGTSGLGKFSSTELSKSMAGKIANASLSMSDKYTGISGLSSHKDIETMFQLIHLHFTSITKDPQTFSQLMNGWQSNLKNRHLSAETAFGDSLRNTVYGYDPRMKPLVIDDLPHISHDRILEIAKERTANAKDWIFTIMGNFDEETIRPFICQYLASLPAKGKVQKGHLTSSFRKGILVNEFKRKMEMPKANAYIFWHNTSMPYTVANATKINIVGQILSMLYIKKIREEASAAYSCGAEGGATLEENYHDFTLLANCPMKPEKRDEALRIMQEEVEKMAEHCDEGMLKKVKEYLIKSVDDAYKTNGYWASVISMYHKYGIDSHTGYKEMVNGITPQDICHFVRDFLKDNNRISIIMMPET